MAEDLDDMLDNLDPGDITYNPPASSEPEEVERHAIIPVLEAQVDQITVEHTLEQVTMIQSRVSIAQRRLKRLAGLLKERMIQWINEHGDIVIGEERQYVGNATSYKAKAEKHELFEEALKAAMGDFRRASEMLSSDCFKWAALRDLLGEETFAKLVSKEVKKDLKTGKPLKQLKTANKFSKQRKSK